MSSWTIWQEMKENWRIKKSRLLDMGIDPKKQWNEITLGELRDLADEFDVLVSDIV